MTRNATRTVFNSQPSQFKAINCALTNQRDFLLTPLSRFVPGMEREEMIIAEVTVEELFSVRQKEEMTSVGWLLGWSAGVWAAHKRIMMDTIPGCSHSLIG